MISNYDTVLCHAIKYFDCYQAVFNIFLAKNKQNAHGDTHCRCIHVWHNVCSGRWPLFIIAVIVANLLQTIHIIYFDIFIQNNLHNVLTNCFCSNMPPNKKHLCRMQQQMLLPCEYAGKRNRNVAITGQVVSDVNTVGSTVQSVCTHRQTQ